MKTLRAVTFFILISISAYAQTNFVELRTNMGNITIMLYDNTPRHKSMFIDEIGKGTYKKALFNRVIKDFVSQAGELDESILADEKLHPKKRPRRLNAEIDSNFIHKKGAIGAGRDDNLQKSSYFNQIYMVSGNVLTDKQLDELENKTRRKMSQKTREIYKTQGGVPHLDFNYTIFGEIVEGLDVAERINKVATHKLNVPVSAIIFDARVLSEKETKARKISQE